MEDCFVLPEGLLDIGLEISKMLANIRTDQGFHK